jgi:hypothetical protein
LLEGDDATPPIGKAGPADTAFFDPEASIEIPNYAVRPWSDHTACRGGGGLNGSSLTSSCENLSVATSVSANPVRTEYCPNDPPLLTAAASPSGTTSSVSIMAIQWLLNGEPIPGAKSLSYRAQKAGNYSAKLVLRASDPNGEYVCSRAAGEVSVKFKLEVDLNLKLFADGILPVAEEPYVGCSSDDFSVDGLVFVAGDPPLPGETGSSDFQVFRDGVLVLEKSVTGTQLTYPVKTSGVYQFVRKGGASCTSASPRRTVRVIRSPRPGFTVERLACNRVVLRRNAGIVPLSSWRWQYRPSRFNGAYTAVPNSELRNEITLVYDENDPETMRSNFYSVHAVRADPNGGSVSCSGDGEDHWVDLSPPLAHLNAENQGAGCEAASLSTEPGKGNYSWIREPLPGETDDSERLSENGSTHLATRSGTYSVTWTNERGCRSDPGIAEVRLFGPPRPDPIPGAAYPVAGCTSCQISIPGEFSFDSRAKLQVRFEVLDDYKSTSNNIITKAAEYGDVLPAPAGSTPGIRISAPNFGRPVLYRIVVHQYGCEDVAVQEDGTGKVAVFAAVNDGQILPLPRIGTTYGGTVVRLFGRSLPALSGIASVQFGTNYAEVLAVRPGEITVRTHASPPAVVVTNVNPTAGPSWVSPESAVYSYVTFGIAGTLSAAGQQGAYLFDVDGMKLVDGDPLTDGINPVFGGARGIARAPRCPVADPGCMWPIGGKFTDSTPARTSPIQVGASRLRGSSTRIRFPRPSPAWRRTLQQVKFANSFRVAASVRRAISARFGSLWMLAPKWPTSTGRSRRTIEDFSMPSSIA